MEKLPPTTLATVSDVDSEAESIMLPPLSEVSAAPAPTSIDHYWHEPEYRNKAGEQANLWDAEGEAAARGDRVEAAGTRLAAETDEATVGDHSTLLTTTLKIHIQTLTALSPFRRRATKARLWHYLAKGAFLLGDLAGIATAAIWMGEIPAIAIIMAVSAAAATVTAGLSGTEVRDVRDRKRRSRLRDDLPEALLPFAHHFDDGDKGWPLAKAVVFASATIGVIIAVAIFGLRSSIEGGLSGLVYGGIALAIAAASFVEQYCYTDAIADQIDATRADYVRARKDHVDLARSASWKKYAEHAAEAESIQNEHALRGKAAGDHLEALSHAIKRRNPAVAGHGPAAQASTIGQTSRRPGANK